MATRKSKKPAKTPSATETVARTARPFPAETLERALQVAYNIKDLNGGNPWATEDVAASFGMGAKANNFYYLTAASRDFGLTTGTRNSSTVELTDFGRELVFAPSPEVEHRKKVEAFHKIELFSKVLKHYLGSDLPEMRYLGNTLQRDFGLDPKWHEEFAISFRENCKYLGITSGDAPSQEDRGRSPSTVLVGEPTTKTSLKAFVIMPFTERNPERPAGFFGEVLASLITPAGLQAGFKVETANRQGSDVIQSTIVNELLEADLVIADLTDHNPNVLFELGLRMAEDKPVALIKAEGTGRVFDVDNMLRVYEYKPQLWRSTIEVDQPGLAKHIQAAWDGRATEQTYMKILRRVASGAQ
jgi:hypothetical protein